MSAANAIGDFDLNAIQLRKKLEFPDGSIQTTAYTGQSGSENLQQVLADGNDAGNLGITNLGTILMTSGAEINQSEFTPFNGNQLDPTIFGSNRPSASTSFNLAVVDYGSGNNSLYFLPRAPDNAYNNLINADDTAIVSLSGVPLTITSEGVTTSGLRINDTSVILGSGGNLNAPTERIVCNSTNSSMTLAYTNLVLSTGTLPATTGASASLFLPVNINGVNYKIPLNLA
jgi:hypothetical protein